jgi:hypothetical protein
LADNVPNEVVNNSQITEGAENVVPLHVDIPRTGGGGSDLLFEAVLQEHLQLPYEDFLLVLPFEGAGIGQSVQRLATGWTTEGSEFESRKGQEFYLLHVVQSGSGDNPASYSMGTEVSFPWDKVAGA